LDWEYNKLRGKIKETCGTQDRFARRLGIGRVSLSQRLNNQLEFSQDEIFKSCDILGIDANDIPAYFFTKKV
jgi:transcriptional regulator with XRE-family HTH domain